MSSARREECLMHATESVTNINPFATLIRKKLLLPSNKTPYTATKMSFLVELLRSRVAQIHVDESWYLNRNPDVRRAVRDGAVKDGREHFVTSGFYEHRLPYEICVDEAWYLECYEDVRQAVLAAAFRPGRLISKRSAIGKAAFLSAVSVWHTMKAEKIMAFAIIVAV